MFSIKNLFKNKPTVEPVIPMIGTFEIGSYCIPVVGGEVRVGTDRQTDIMDWKFPFSLTQLVPSRVIYQFKVGDLPDNFLLHPAVSEAHLTLRLPNHFREERHSFDDPKLEISDGNVLTVKAHKVYVQNGNPENWVGIEQLQSWAREQEEARQAQVAKENEERSHFANLLANLLDDNAVSVRDEWETMIGDEENPEDEDYSYFYLKGRFDFLKIAKTLGDYPADPEEFAKVIIRSLHDNSPLYGSVVFIDNLRDVELEHGYYDLIAVAAELINYLKTDGGEGE